MDNNSAFGQLLEEGQNTAANTISDVTNSIKNQTLSGKNAAQQQAFNSTPNQQSEISNQQAQEQTRDIVKDFYAPSDDLISNSNNSSQSDQERLTQTRQDLQLQKQKYNDLHREVYYDPLFAYEQKKLEPTKAQEQEEEKQDKMQELAQAQAKKGQDINLQREQTKTEANPGVAG